MVGGFGLSCTTNGKLHLLQARILFPYAMDNIYRHHGLRHGFCEIFMELPKPKDVICSVLDILRRYLIRGYNLVEATLPNSINMSVFEEKTYDIFKKAFVSFQELEYALQFIPEIPDKFLGSTKRPRGGVDG